MRIKVVSSKKVLKADRTPHLVKVDPKDKKRVLSSKSKDFETATGSFIWASNKGLKKLNISGIKHEVVSDTVKATKKVSAALDNAGTLTQAELGYIKNGNGTFYIQVVETPGSDLALATYDIDNDEYDILENVKSIDEAYERANILFKNNDEFVLYSKPTTASKRVSKSSKKITAARTPKTREQTILQANYYDGSGWYDCGSLGSGYTVWSDDYEAVRKLREEYKKSKSNPNDPGSYRLITRRVPNPDYVEPNPDMVTNMQPYELRDNYYAKHPDGHFFDPETLKFFGERWSDMKISHDLVEIKDYRGNPHICYELVTKQRNAPGGTKTSYHYFDRDTFDEILV